MMIVTYDLDFDFDPDVQCQALCEEEIYALQEELSLFPLGWIHVCIISHVFLDFIFLILLIISFPFS